MSKRRRKKRHKQIKRILGIIGITSVGLFCCWGVYESYTSSRNESPYSSQYETHQQLNEIRELSNEQFETSDEYQTILNNKEKYPDELLEALSKNPELLEFVSGYPERDADIPASVTADEIKNGVPLLIQWDKRWGYKSYGDSCIGLAGCAPTCLSMVVMALTGDKTATPNQVAAYAEKNGYYVENAGTSWTFMTEGAFYFGIEGSELCLDKNVIFNALQSGQLIICSMGPGDFTTQGHFIVLTGVEDGKLVVNDPNSRNRSRMLWDYERVERQIKNLWVYHVT